jgi:hypothetical protein
VTTFPWAAEQNIYQGPLLNVTVEREGQRLPIGLVNHLTKGDRLWVQPELSSLAPGDWIVFLATISPSGNQIQTQRFNLKDKEVHPVIDITDEHQLPVILVAPQVRNMFGLYTSFNESSDLLKDAVQGDPQLFLQLQKLDLVNQAISALREDLDQILKDKTPDDAIQATQTLAARFGVRSIDPECFKNNLVNTPCVALSMVTNRDFVIPTSSDLSSVFGQQKADDLTSYLTSSLHVISAASDFLTNKFRDQYDFAPSFGRQTDSDTMVRLFALSRFRNGDIKTVYVYTPAWFNSAMPTLNWASSPIPQCLFKWQLSARVKGQLPVLNYWHDWQMNVTDPATKQTLLTTKDVSFKPGLGVLELGATTQSELLKLTVPQAQVQLNASFGFMPVQWAAFDVRLPVQQEVASIFKGWETLISGEQATLNGASASATACVQSLQLQTPDQSLQAQVPRSGQWTFDLTHTTANNATLSIAQSGLPIQTISVRVQAPRAQVSTIEHANLSNQIKIKGNRLDRIQSLSWTQTQCVKLTGDAQSSVFTCDHDIQNNAMLPDKVTITHQDQEPASFSWPLIKTKSAPLVSIASSTPNALLIQPSTTALQWGLGPQDELLSQDSGLILLLQTQAGYSLESGSYHLEMKLRDDPLTAQQPLTATLITDIAHNELRTRNPVNFTKLKLPSVINPVYWRVVQDASGLSSNWQATNKSVLFLPQLSSWSCAPEPHQVLLHGTHLDLIDHVFFEDATNPHLAPLPVNCSDGLCLQLSTPPTQTPLHVELHWLKDHPFVVRMPELPSCNNQ